MAIWASTGTPASIQALHNQSATVAGDTITMPAGEFHWTTSVSFTKGITLQGLTTVNSNTGVCNDQTIVYDNVVKDAGGNGPIFAAGCPAMGAPFPVRLTGITFKTGNIADGFNGGIVFSTDNNTPTDRARYDHCRYSSQTNSNHMGIYGPVYGICDHLVVDSPTTPWGQKGQSQIQNGRGSYGDQDFVDLAGNGGPNWWFVENCWFDNSTSAINSGGAGFDSMRGGKTVFRYNKFWNLTIIMHGTGHAAGRRRGGRAHEFYNNEFDFPYVQQIAMDGIGSGTLVAHDNTFTGPTAPAGWNLALTRAYKQWVVWGGATGEDGIDSNVTEADGTHVDGHSPFVFASGTITGASVSGDRQFITDSTKNWAPNQWAGYTASQPGGWMGAIISNNNNTLTMFIEGGGGFTGGSTYKIQKVVSALDEPGNSGGQLLINDPPVNQATGTRSWPHQTIEGCYSWNNIHTPSGTHINFSVPQPWNGFYQVISGRNYFNDTPKPGYSTYTYPHPMVSTELVTDRRKYTRRQL